MPPASAAAGSSTRWSLPIDEAQRVRDDEADEADAAGGRDRDGGRERRERVQRERDARHRDAERRGGIARRARAR